MLARGWRLQETKSLGKSSGLSFWGSTFQLMFATKKRSNSLSWSREVCWGLVTQLSLRSCQVSVSITMQWGLNFLSVWSLRMDYVPRFSSSLVIGIFVSFQCWSTNVGFIKRIGEQGLLTTRLLVRRRVRIKIVVNLMRFQLIEGSRSSNRRLQVGKKQVVETPLLLRYVLHVGPQVIASLQHLKFFVLNICTKQRNRRPICNRDEYIFKIIQLHKHNEYTQSNEMLKTH